VSISSEVAPEIREYERTVTTIANAYVQPAMDRYLRDTEKLIRELGCQATIYLLASGGGLVPLDVGRTLPVRLVESGPTAGAVAAAEYGHRLGAADMVSFDMGGTTAKICLIRNGQPTLSDEMEVAREARFRKGSGIVLRVPAIEMIEIGAGGGSIAHVDRLGLLGVGPQSAGAHPGPACYGRGGAEPTVTDASVVLGYLDPDSFLGGDMQLDARAARLAIEERIAGPLGMSVEDAAVGIVDIVNENMATATRVYAAEKGDDLRSFSLMAFGGAGPAHACRIAELLGISSVIYPLAAGVFSSVGLHLTAKSFALVHGYLAPLDFLDWVYVDQLIESMNREATATLALAGVEPEAVAMSISADMRYAGQAFELLVPLAREDVSSRDPKRIADRFASTYLKTFMQPVRDVPIEVIAWRVQASGPQPTNNLRLAKGTATSRNLNSSRRMYVREEHRFVDVPVFDRYLLEPGSAIQGPAVIVERESTAIVSPNASASVDHEMNLILELG
jgi:N-methylhydantoinase A